VPKLPDNACLGLRLYFKSPSLGRIKVIDVDATEVVPLPGTAG
jgi:hypothetical protein